VKISYPLFILFLFLCFRVNAQDADDRLLADALDRRTILRKDTLYLFYVAEEGKIVKPDINKLYYWFRTDTVLTTAGGFGGRVLNGEYKVYYPNKNLREAGQFRYGLKVGDWKIWNPDGSLQTLVQWKEGEEKIGKHHRG